MKKSNFWTFLFGLQLFFILVKIYQHNTVVNLLYSKQKQALFLVSLKKEKDFELMKLLTLRNRLNTKKTAETKLHFSPLKLSQIVSQVETASGEENA